MSGRPGIAEKRLSVHRFQQLHDPVPPDSDGHSYNMANPNDVTIDIPLTNVSSRTQSQKGQRKGDGFNASSSGQYDADLSQQSTEKAGLVDNGRRKRTADEVKGMSMEEPEDGTLNRMGRIYQTILNFSIITRYLIYVTPIALLIAVPIIVGATVAQDAKIGGVAIHWFFTWIEVVWCSLWVCKVFARFIPFIFQFLCGIVSSGTRKYALLLRALEIPLSIVLWCVASLVTFLPVMTYNPQTRADGDTTPKSWEKSVKNILFALFVCSLIFLGEKTMVQLISVSYHRKQFDTKIKESKRNIFLIGQLYEASRNMFPMYCKEFRDIDSIISDTFLGAATAKRPGHGRTNSGAPLRLIRNVGQNVGRFGDKVTTAFGNVAQEITGKQVFNPTSAHSVVTQALERKKATEALARRIWMSCVIEGREALYLDDIMEVLGPGHEAEAEECFQTLDRDGNGDISLDEMVLAVGEIGHGRKSLNHSLHDVDQAIHVLDNLLMSVAFIVGVLVFVSFVTTGFGTVIAAGATSLLSLSFVFSTTAQEVLGSCIFLFVKHPFDVGDRVEISDKPFVVERISLLFSVFRSVTDHRITQVPNVVLNTLWIDNFTRANAMHEQLTIPIKFETTFATIQNLKEEMERFVRDKDNCRDFQPDINIEVVGVGDMDKLQLCVDIRHKSNWSNETVRATRRSKFMCALVLAVRKIPVCAPGAEDPPGEDAKDDDTDKPDEPKPMVIPEAITETSTLHPDGKSTGIDTRLSSGSLQRRSTKSQQQQQQSEAAFADQLNSRASALEDHHDNDTYTTPAASPRPDRSLSVANTLAREPSTGRRKEGTSAPAPTYNDVPIISEPVPHQQRDQFTTPPPPEQPTFQTPQYHTYPSGYEPAQESAYDPEQTPGLPPATEPLQYPVSPTPPEPPRHYQTQAEQRWPRQ